MAAYRTILLVFLLLVMATLQAQTPYNFRKLNATQGLADGVVKAIGQDKYGYMWVATLSGLNRFNGYSVQTFYNRPNDSTSPPAAQVRSIFCDSDGRLWFGSDRGFFEFEYGRRSFRRIRMPEEAAVYKMRADRQGRLYLHTNRGLLRYTAPTGRFEFLTTATQEPGPELNDFIISGRELYLVNDRGVFSLDTETGSWSRLAFPIPSGEFPDRIVRDGKGRLWLSTYGPHRSLVHWHPGTGATGRVMEVFDNPEGFVYGIIARMLVDRDGVVWLSSNLNGLIRIHPVTLRAEFHRHDPVNISSPSTNQFNELFQEANGFIWAGTEGNGVQYFHPRQNLFQTMLPPLDVLKFIPSLWARTFVELPDGQSFAAYGGALVQHSPAGYRVLRNDANRPDLLYDNSVRSLLVDRDDGLWIGTASGMNYLPKGAASPGKFGEADSLPLTFYWSILQDRNGAIWFGERDNLRYWKPGESTAHTVYAHPVLAPLLNRGVRCLYEDRKGRLWMGMNGSGLAMFDPAANRLQQWRRKGDNDSSLIDNLVIGIAEDADGMMWFSSFNGLMSMDPQTGKVNWFTRENGMPSVKTSGLLVDARNRLWIGSTAGLLMLDSTRQRFRAFDVRDGLPIMEFSDMPAARMPNGDFVFPTLRGFIRFNPLAYEAVSREVQVVVSGLTISGKAFTSGNTEDLQSLDLRYDQNFLAFELTGFNYNNPEQTWYAYKLEGFDKDWIYTRDRMVNYTNIPGGNYVFRFKATSDPNFWPSEERLVRVHIGTVFYKSIWFWSLFSVLVLLGGYFLYRFRLRQQRRIFRLQSRAQALEKEKTQVLYESLKQQLNPHFLFNSLTSLQSLIKLDQKTAGQFLEGMSKMYRYILKSSETELVPLGDEVRFVGHYVRLQTIRFETGFEVTIDVPEDYFYRKIAPVTLQNLLENAIKHNIIDEDQPLVVRIYVEDDCIVVRNNLQKKRFVETSNKQGLVNLVSLYRYLTNRPVTWAETDACFTIKIPLI